MYLLDSTVPRKPTISRSYSYKETNLTKTHSSSVVAFFVNSFYRMISGSSDEDKLPTYIASSFLLHSPLNTNEFWYPTYSQVSALYSIFNPKFN
jgi:hypothetical protein